MNMSRVINNLVRHEGKVIKRERHRLYRDSVGKLTVGYGRNIDDRGISEVEAKYLLHNDVQDTINDLRREFWWFDELDDVRQEVVINMAFNMGIVTFSEFRNTIAYIGEGKFEQASRNMLASKWARQVGYRAQELAREMASGIAEDYA